MTKILFIHNTAMWYRKPFFKRLSKLYDIKFVFTHIQVCKNIYGIPISEDIEDFNNVNYRVLKNYFNFIKPHGIALGIIVETTKDYDLVVGGSWDSIAEIIETSIYFTISKIRKIPFIIFREDWHGSGDSFKRKLISPFVNILIKYSDAILVPGTMHKKYFISLGAQPHKIYIMPNVNHLYLNKSNYLYEQQLIDELNLTDKKVILYVGRLVEQKGVDYLIQAFAKVIQKTREVVLIIVGEGTYKKELEQITHNLGIKDYVYFRGYVAQEDELSAYYLLCNFCVVPSIMRDAWGFVINESMAFGKPVISTDAVGAAFDMIEDGVNGFIVPQRDVNALCSAMFKILSNSELEIKMGNKSSTIIQKKFQYEHMIFGFNEAIESVIKKV